MNSTSQQQTLSITFSNLYSVNHTITNGNINAASYVFYDTNVSSHKEWVNCFPDWNKVQLLCELHPGLALALRNFKTLYTLINTNELNNKG
jgi:hypothetical protein